MDMKFAYRDFLSMNGWPAGCYSTAQYEWYSYFEQLGLISAFCAEPVLAEDKTFSANIFIGDWVAMVFVAEEASAVNYSNLDFCIASARELAFTAPIDALVVSGSPKNSSGQIRLYNRDTLDLEASEEPFENLWFVSGVKSVKRKKHIAWCLENYNGLSYLLPGQIMRFPCSCKSTRCKTCRLELKRAPLWIEAPRTISEKDMQPRWETGIVINTLPGAPDLFSMH